MKHETPDTWFTLGACYHLEPNADPFRLLDDASLFLEGARAMAQSLNELLVCADRPNTDDLATAMWGVALLIELGQRNSDIAHRKLAQSSPSMH